jgi:hypothetical protein
LETRQYNGSHEAVHNVVLLLESASDTVDGLRELSRSLDESLEQGAGLNTVIALLQQKKAKVDILRDLASEIRTQLRINAAGQIGVDLPGTSKLRFAQLMADLRQLLEDEARLETLICGRGLTITRGTR